MKIRGVPAVSWTDYRLAIESADHVPPESYLVRNFAGNFTLVNERGQPLGYIDTLGAEVVVYDHAL